MSTATTLTKKRRQTFIVIGAGPVGLQAALLLSKTGHTVTVYDKLSRDHVVGVKRNSLLRTNKERTPTTWSRVLACDGVSSVARKESERTFGPDGTAHASLRQEYYGYSGCAGPKNFVSQVTPWAVQFRVLFSSQPLGGDAQTTRLSLDPGVHYIFNGIYTAVINPGDSSTVNRWSIVVSIKDTDNDATRALLTSDDASPENVRQLREYVEQKSSQLGPYLSNDDLKAFFQRRIFRGALVRVNQLNVGEFLCLLGDAAHSAIPPTGEGINSGLEDCKILYELLQNDNANNSETSKVTTSKTTTTTTTTVVPPDLFAQFNNQRIQDVQALNEIAFYLNENFYANRSEKIARVLSKILASIRYKLYLGPPLYEAFTFGKQSNPPVPYSKVAETFRSNLTGLNIFRYLLGLFLGRAEKINKDTSPC